MQATAIYCVSRFQGYMVALRSLTRSRPLVPWMPETALAIAQGNLSTDTTH